MLGGRILGVMGTLTWEPMTLRPLLGAGGAKAGGVDMSLLPQPLQFPWAQLPLGHLFLPSESCPWALLPPPFLLPPCTVPAFSSPCRYISCPERHGVPVPLTRRLP